MEGYITLHYIVLSQSQTYVMQDLTVTCTLQITLSDFPPESLHSILILRPRSILYFNRSTNITLLETRSSGWREIVKNDTIWNPFYYYRWILHIMKTEHYILQNRKNSQKFVLLMNGSLYHWFIQDEKKHKGRENILLGMEVPFLIIYKTNHYRLNSNSKVRCCAGTHYCDSNSISLMKIGRREIVKNGTIWNPFYYYKWFLHIMKTGH